MRPIYGVPKPRLIYQALFANEALDSQVHFHTTYVPQGPVTHATFSW